MTVEPSSLFTQIIQEHLELKRRNADLDRQMPIDRYLKEDTFENHPLFKSEHQARLEETMDGVDAKMLAPVGAPAPVLRWPGEGDLDSAEAPVAANEPESGEESLWGRSRDFDWGD
jgi:hypothetical protein